MLIDLLPYRVRQGIPDRVTVDAENTNKPRERVNGLTQQHGGA